MREQYYKGTGPSDMPDEWEADFRSMIAERSLAFTPRVTSGITPGDEIKGHFIESSQTTKQNTNIQKRGEVTLYERNKKN